MRTDNLQDFRELKKDDDLWMDSKGKVFFIDEMSCRHVYYAVKLLQQESPKYKKVFKKEIEIPLRLLRRYEKCKKYNPELYI
jgi:hypothetical protein